MTLTQKIKRALREPKYLLNDSGGVVTCKNKDEFDINEAKEKLKKGLATNFYYQNREWPYKNVKPRILAEKYMEDGSSYELKDYWNVYFCRS